MPICYGRLKLDTESIEKLCVCEIEMLIKGWLQRYYDLQDLFIINCALPVYQMNMKRPPCYEDVVKGRQRAGSNSDFSLEELEYLASEE